MKRYAVYGLLTAFIVAGSVVLADEPDPIFDLKLKTNELPKIINKLLSENTDLQEAVQKSLEDLTKSPIFEQDLILDRKLSIQLTKLSIDLKKTQVSHITKDEQRDEMKDLNPQDHQLNGAEYELRIPIREFQADGNIYLPHQFESGTQFKVKLKKNSVLNPRDPELVVRVVMGKDGLLLHLNLLDGLSDFFPFIDGAVLQVEGNDSSLLNQGISSVGNWIGTFFRPETHFSNAVVFWALKDGISRVGKDIGVAISESVNTVLKDLTLSFRDLESLNDEIYLNGTELQTRLEKEAHEHLDLMTELRDYELELGDDHRSGWKTAKKASELKKHTENFVNDSADIQELLKGRNSKEVLELLKYKKERDLWLSDAFEKLSKNTNEKKREVKQNVFGFKFQNSESQHYRKAKEDLQAASLLLVTQVEKTAQLLEEKESALKQKGSPPIKEISLAVKQIEDSVRIQAILGQHPQPGCLEKSHSIMPRKTGLRVKLGLSRLNKLLQEYFDKDILNSVLKANGIEATISQYPSIQYDIEKKKYYLSLGTTHIDRINGGSVASRLIPKITATRVYFNFMICKKEDQTESLCMIPKAEKEKGKHLSDDLRSLFYTQILKIVTLGSAIDLLPQVPGVQLSPTQITESPEGISVFFAAI